MSRKNFENEIAFVLFGGFFIAALFLVETDRFQVIAAIQRLIAG